VDAGSCNECPHKQNGTRKQSGDGTVIAEAFNDMTGKESGRKLVTTVKTKR